MIGVRAYPRHGKDMHNRHADLARRRAGRQRCLMNVPAEYSSKAMLMRHVHAEHGDDWFEIEEIYQATRRIIRRKLGG